MIAMTRSPPARIDYADYAGYDDYIGYLAAGRQGQDAICHKPLAGFIIRRA
jgi:hypothetical protein